MARRNKAEEWIWVFQQQLRQIVTDKHAVSGQMLRVLLLLLSMIGFAQWVHVKQTWIAQELGMQRSHVSAALRKLVEYGIVRRRHSLVHGTQYSVSSQVAYKGAGDGLASRRARETHRQE